MSLLQSVETGAAGVRWTAPSSLTWSHQHAHFAIGQDGERGVTWFLRRMPWRIDLRAAYDDALRSDLEADARAEFERSFVVPDAPLSPHHARPRTADPGWSPIVEVERARIGEAAALRVVRRITYQPGNEIVRGSWIVPLADGYFELAAGAHAATTGLRESVLMTTLQVKFEGEATVFPPQSAYDAAEHDGLFPDHPLSRVRAALRWIVREGGLAVTAPMAEAPVGDVTLDAPRCTITPPPRFLFVPRAVMPMAETLASLVRCTFPEAPLRMIDVWRLGEPLRGADRAERLRELARRSTAAWVNEGVTALRHAPAVVPGDGASAAVEDVVRFAVDGAPKLSAMRWRVDDDGTVFRVCAGGAGGDDVAALVDQARAVMASLRRG